MGYDPGTGKQRQKSITGKTQKEVAQKLRQVTTEVDSGTYLEPSRLTVGQWLDIWKDTYLGGIKPRTVEIYQDDIAHHIAPHLGAIRLEELNGFTIQQFYNGLVRSGLSPKTVRNIHGVLHSALRQAVRNQLLRFNPADNCVLPKIEKTDLNPLDEEDIERFLTVIRGNPYEDIFIVTLFTGMREGEVLGLTWDCIDFDHATITVNKQLRRLRRAAGSFVLASTKNGKTRTIAVGETILAQLKKRKRQQTIWQLRAGSAWNNPDQLVFTNELGRYLIHSTVYQAFKRAAVQIGRGDARFHDLRHSYAVAAIRAGDDIKTVQENLGHATAAFTLDVYGHVTPQMKKASAERMEQFIRSVSGQ